MTANEKRLAVVNKYKTLLGRNLYSQPRRDYCFRKYSNGKYYSDCSSSISYAYKEAGFGFGILNTVGMYQSKKLTVVDVTIKNGIPQEVDRLRIGDMLLFAGTDSSRAYADYVGHVEMVYAINGNTVTICGHGSGTPSTKNMVTYCRSRYNKKTNSTSRGNKGLIKIVRFIQDDDEAAPTPIENAIIVTGNTVNVRYGPSTAYKVFKVARRGDRYSKPNVNGWTPIDFEGYARWMSSKYIGTEGVCTGNTVNIRTGPGTQYQSVGIARKNDRLALLKKPSWVPIEIENAVYWISDQYVA